jgi:hypothetical protein
MKHYDGEMIRLEMLDEEIPKKETEGIIIKYKELEFKFFPRVIVKDPTGYPIFAFKFNDGESLALYWKESNAPKVDEMLQTLIMTARFGGFTPMDIMDYIPEIYKTAKLAQKNQLPLKDGPHPDWKGRDSV